MKINTEFIVIIEAKIIDPENLEIFFKIWNSRVNSPSKYEQFINGDNLRIIEIYSNSEDCLNHIKTVNPYLPEYHKKIKFISVSIYGSVSGKLKQKLSDLNVNYFERIGNAQIF